MAATIPDQLYVTLQFRGEVKNEDGLLGFASPYTRDSAFEKRKNTQDNWAYGTGVTVDIDDQDNITVSGQGHRGGYGRGETWDAAMLFMTNAYPRILKNEPVAGFQLAKSVRRSGWSGSGNVVWRITDPRGFDLEITSENFASVLNCSDVIKGVIQGRCVWGRDGSKNILLPEASEPFQAAQTQTRKVNSRISLRDIRPGDRVEVLARDIDAVDQSDCVFLGKYHFLGFAYGEQDKTGYGYEGVIRLAGETLERYLFQGTASGNYFVLGSPKITRIIESALQVRDRAEVAQAVTKHLASGGEIDNFASNIILASASRIDPEKVQSRLVPSDFTYTPGDEWPKRRSYYHQTFAVVWNGQTYLSSMRHRHHSSVNLVLLPLDFDAENNRIQIHQVEESRHNGGWGYSGRVFRRHAEFTDFKLEELKYYDIEVSLGDLVGCVNLST
jgi:hypothetical protein